MFWVRKSGERIPRKVFGFGTVCRKKREILLAVPKQSNNLEVCVERNADSGMGYLTFESRPRTIIENVLGNVLGSEIGGAEIPKIRVRNFSSPDTDDESQYSRESQALGIGEMYLRHHLANTM